MKNNKQEVYLRAGWKGLSEIDDAKEWETFPFDDKSSGVFKIGVHSPEKSEAVLVRIPEDVCCNDREFPQGKGFEVSSIRDEKGEPFRWIALKRRSQGSLDLFTTMALDIIGLLYRSNCSEREFLPLFLHRIRAWQKFMEVDSPGKLSPSVIIGLMGELQLLSSFLDCGFPPRDVIEAWIGPLGGLHDFVFNTLHFEVKSTVSESGFPVQIGSANQLDTGVCSPLCLYACRFSKEKGISPSARVREIEERLYVDNRAVEEFRSRLLCLGVADMKTLEDVGHFDLIETALYRITDDFPVLMASKLPVEIGKVRYQIDLSMLKQPKENLSDLLHSIGEYSNGIC